jgi:hypothetical protein
VASYFNTVVILIALCIFVFNVYVVSPELGSPDNMWDGLNAVVGVDDPAGEEAVAGNQVMTRVGEGRVGTEWGQSAEIS